MQVFKTLSSINISDSLSTEVPPSGQKRATFYNTQEPGTTGQVIPNTVAIGTKPTKEPKGNHNRGKPAENTEKPLKQVKYSKHSRLCGLVSIWDSKVVFLGLIPAWWLLYHDNNRGRHSANLILLPDMHLYVAILNLTVSWLSACSWCQNVFRKKIYVKHMSGTMYENTTITMPTTFWYLMWSFARVCGGCSIWYQCYVHLDSSTNVFFNI